jgi:hypothetical protein
MSVRLFLCPHVTSPLLLGRFEYNLISQIVTEIRTENTNLVIIATKKSKPLEEDGSNFTFLRTIQNIHKTSVARQTKGIMAVIAL